MTNKYRVKTYVLALTPAEAIVRAGLNAGQVYSVVQTDVHQVGNVWEVSAWLEAVPTVEDRTKETS